MSITIGKFYVWTEGFLVRQVMGINGNDIIYQDFSLEDGVSISVGSVCSLNYFKKNIVREATQEEIQKLDTEQASIKLTNNIIMLFINNFEKQIVNELRLRGYKITKSEESYNDK